MSFGKGLGQQTGGTPDEDQQEAREIIAMINKVPDHRLIDELNEWQLKFIHDMRVAVRHERVTGKQLFKLRDTKDELVSKGLI